MRLTPYILLLLPFAVMFSGCHRHHEYADNPYGNFDALWKTIDEHYCFFDENGLDWDETGANYRALLSPEMSEHELFDVCAGLLAELKDGHVNLSSPFNTFYYREWWTAYPQNFSLRTLQQYYLDFDWQTISGIMYKELPGEVGYMRIGSFSVPLGEGALDQVLAALYHCKGLVIDVRDNGGGELTNAQRLISRFISEKKPYAYISHKTAPGHDDFSEPYPIKLTPSVGRVVWRKPAVVLVNRSTFSAANFFASVMKSLPSVILIGSETGGGGGLPFSAQLPNGWRVRFSAAPVTNASLESIEKGVKPTDGYEIIASEIELARGHDAVLDKALSIIRALPSDTE